MVYAGRVLAVDGIELGMTTEQVRQKLATPGAIVQDTVEHSPLRLTSQGVATIALPYIYEISSLRQVRRRASNTTTAVRFGLPSTGSRVVSIRSTTVYTSLAAEPTFDAILRRLRGAYGPASAEASAIDSSFIATLPWVFSSKDQVSCSNQGCGLSDLALDGNDLSNSRSLVLEGKEVGLIAMLARSEDEIGSFAPTSHLHLVSIGLYDYANMLLTVEQGMAQLRAAAVAVAGRRIDQDQRP